MVVELPLVRQHTSQKVREPTEFERFLSEALDQLPVYSQYAHLVLGALFALYTPDQSPFSAPSVLESGQEQRRIVVLMSGHMDNNPNRPLNDLIALKVLTSLPVIGVLPHPSVA